MDKITEAQADELLSNLIIRYKDKIDGCVDFTETRKATKEQWINSEFMDESNIAKSIRMLIKIFGWTDDIRNCSSGGRCPGDIEEVIELLKKEQGENP